MVFCLLAYEAVEHILTDINIIWKRKKEARRLFEVKIVVNQGPNISKTREWK